MQNQTLEQAQEAGKQGALVAAKHADAEIADWATDAAILFVDYARDVMKGQPFLTEDAREWAEKGGFPPPPDRRAWGFISMSMHRAGHVTQCGYAPARTSNGSPKVLWRAA